jgi:UDP-GlcNAc3NAcA epimerase
MKIVTVVGARPQFIKAAAVSRAINDYNARDIIEVMVHTGQHHDRNMSEVFFEDLGIPPPSYNLGISGGSHGVMTGKMIIAIEALLQVERPDWLLVYGDTNSTLAAVIAAAKLGIPIAHVEAGVRSFRPQMPEEINRVVTDRLANALFCPTGTAVQNLKSEGRVEGIHNVGDVMLDIVRRFRDVALRQSPILDALELRNRQFVLATCHRAENTDSAENLTAILAALVRIASELPVLLPLHPRTRKQISAFGLDPMLEDLKVLPPLAFLDMLALLQASHMILTDSGGIQKEAFFLSVPCVTMRTETEWPETLEGGYNIIAGTSTDGLVSAFFEAHSRTRLPVTSQPFGNGRAGESIVSILAR